MSSPSKCQRTGDDPSDLYPDPERTPRRPRQLLSRHDNDVDVFHVPAPEAVVSPGSTSSTAILATRAAFSSPAIPPLALTKTSHSATQSRGSSPSKRFQKTANLINLVRPVRFVKPTSEALFRMTLEHCLRRFPLSRRKKRSCQLLLDDIRISRTREFGRLCGTPMWTQAWTTGQRTRLMVAFEPSLVIQYLV